MNTEYLNRCADTLRTSWEELRQSERDEVLEISISMHSARCNRIQKEFRTLGDLWDSLLPKPM